MKITIEKETERTHKARSFFLGTSMARKAPGSDASLPELRQAITELVSRNAVAMVQCAIDGVMEEGQYQAIKYLFEMVGIYPSTSGEDDVTGDSLAKVLLRHLGMAESESQDESRSSRAVQVHPVK